MRSICLMLLLSLIVGCGSAATPMAASTTIKGKLESSGKPVGGVLLTLQPLGEGHPVPMEVAADGSFTGDVVPGNYVYYVGKSAAKSTKNPDQAIKQVNEKFHQADMSRKVTVKSGEDIKIGLD